MTIPAVIPPGYVIIQNDLSSVRRLWPEAAVYLISGWTVVEPDDPQPPLDLYPAVVEDVELDAKMAALLDEAESETLARLRAAFGSDASGRIMAPKLRRYSGLPAQPVATTGGIGHSTGTGTAGGLFTSREPYKMAVACTDIQLVYPLGWVLSSGGAIGEIPTTATLPALKASIELPDGTIHPVYFRGARSVPVEPNTNVVSDPIAVDLAAGDVIYVRTFSNATTGTQYTMGASSYGPGITVSGTIGFTNAADLTDSGTAFTSDLAKNYWSPIVCGQPLGAPVATVGLVGDSITVGQGSTNNSFAWWKHGLANSRPAFCYARSGVLAQGIAAAHKRGFPLLQGLTHALVLLGTNDAGRTFAQIQADLLAIWTNLANRGIKVYGCTINPTTTSTDSWATTANQTVKSGEAVRVQINDWIRTTPAPLTGYIDTADATESARNSGKWKVTGAANYATTDGTHPTDVMHQAMGAAIPVSALTI